MNGLVFDESSHLLRENLYSYALQDVAEPKLYEEVFEYSAVPRIAFNGRLTPMCMPEEICITDTTFRDGQQSMTAFTPMQVRDIFDLLHRLGGPMGVIRQSEFFVYSGRDREAVELCRGRGYRFPEITAWIRATEQDFALVKDMGLTETGLLMSCSDYHIFKKMNMTRRQAMELYLGVAEKALEKGIRPRCHLEDVTRADFYGFVLPLATALSRLSEQAGLPIKLRCCDTLGLGVSYPGASLPRSVPGILYGLRHYANVPSGMLEWHGHNDFYKAVTNAATAWLYGASAVNCTVLGIGERTGNCPLEAMVMEYCALRGGTNGMELPVLTELARYFEHTLGYAIPAKTPFMGREFCQTRAGIHADGLNKCEQVYSIFDTAALLDRPAEVLVDAHSGLAGIAHWVNRNIPACAEADKRDPRIARVKALADALYEGGRREALSDAELRALWDEACGGAVQPRF